jgi:hypothetical protein
MPVRLRLIHRPDYAAGRPKGQSELGGDGGPVDDRPDGGDPAVGDFVEDVLAERDPPAGNGPKIVLEHPPLAREPEPLAVAPDVRVDERAKPRSVLRVQTGDVAAIEVGELGSGHVGFLLCPVAPRQGIPVGAGRVTLVT